MLSANTVSMAKKNQSHSIALEQPGSPEYTSVPADSLGFLEANDPEKQQAAKQPEKSPKIKAPRVKRALRSSAC